MKIEMSHSCFLFLCASMLFALAEKTFAKGADATIVAMERKNDEVRLDVHPFAYSFRYRDEPYAGYGFGAGLEYAFKKDWSVYTGINQGFSIQDKAALFTSLDLGLSYALSGTIPQENSSIFLKGKKIAHFQSNPPGGWRIGLGMNQYFLNGVDTTIPFSGVSTSLFYEIPTSLNVSVSLGVKVDRLSNTEDVVGNFQTLIRALLYI